MSELVDHLAELTGFRDRDRLDVTLVGVLRDLLRPRSVAIYRPVGDAATRHWMTRARLGLADAVASADSAWIDLDSLPLLDAYPARCAALAGTTLCAPGGLNVFPLTSDHDVVGVLEIESDQPLDEPARRLVGSILRIYQNFQSLLDYSERDTLTGLLNRKTFDESFFKSFAQTAPGTVGADDGRRSAATTPRHWLGMIDIDFFKSVNDKHGHQIGDEVLLLVSRLMHGSFRFHDRLYRFGGEEFVVLMTCDSEQGAAQAFERLRRNTEAYVFPQVGHITLSAGFSEIMAGDSPGDALERADRAVYCAKAHGRNRVLGYAELVASGELKVSAKAGEIELF
jgi:diguanylate cyclase (GGDEF)-like protein